MKTFLFLMTVLLMPIGLFAESAVDCCESKLTVSAVQNDNPILKSLPNLQVVPLPDWEENLLDMRTAGLPLVSSDLSISQYAYVDREILFFQEAFKPRFEASLSRAGRYLPMIQKMLKESGLPEDIVYLPLIESGFNPKAISRAKAIGLWQFMKPTARRYGLRVDGWIDERYDVEKSTRAAIAYLSDLYGMFGSWHLSMASYNAGEGRIGRALASTGSSDYWTLKEMLGIPQETSQYVPKFIAASMIARNPEGYGFSVDYERPLSYDLVSIKRQTSLPAVSRATGISVATIKAYNPELRKNTTPPNYPGYLLKLPVGGKAIFLENQATLASFSNGRGDESLSRRAVLTRKAKKSSLKATSVRHRIKRGETIHSISKKYNVAALQILQANRLTKKSIIRTGRSLLIPRA
ncbi:MAG: transglycosylase SLT domain-containing protein [Nitrospirota bacterium]